MKGRLLVFHILQAFKKKIVVERIERFILGP